MQNSQLTFASTVRNIVGKYFSRLSQGITKMPWLIFIYWQNNCCGLACLQAIIQIDINRPTGRSEKITIILERGTTGEKEQ